MQRCRERLANCQMPGGWRVREKIAIPAFVPFVAVLAVRTRCYGNTAMITVRDPLFRVALTGNGMVAADCVGGDDLRDRGNDRKQQDRNQAQHCDAALQSKGSREPHARMVARLEFSAREYFHPATVLDCPFPPRAR